MESTRDYAMDLPLLHIPIHLLSEYPSPTNEHKLVPVSNLFQQRLISFVDYNKEQLKYWINQNKGNMYCEADLTYAISPLSIFNMK